MEINAADKVSDKNLIIVPDDVTVNTKLPLELSKYKAPSFAKLLVLEYFPVGSNKSKFFDTPIELILMALLFII